VTEPRDRRELILAKAGELFARKGIAGTTVREIADAVGVLSGSLYHHFESKDAIVDELLTVYFSAVKVRYAEVLASGKPSEERLHDLILASLELAATQRDAIAIYQAESNYLREQPRFKYIQAATADVQRSWLEVIDAGVADGSFRDDVDPRVFYRLVRDAVWLSVHWHRPGGEYSTTTLADEITSVFVHGFGRTKPSARRDRSATRRNG
jgi:TetR/AcrR family transcriptional regulator, cholesterol catabolism regulator